MTPAGHIAWLRKVGGPDPTFEPWSSPWDHIEALCDAYEALAAAARTHLDEHLACACRETFPPLLGEAS